MVGVTSVGRRGRRAFFVVAAGLVAGFAFATSGTALAASPAASCMGHEATGISPPGSSDEFPDGMPSLRAFIAENFPGVPPGAIYSTIARLHEGLHEACDEVLDG